jgi:hypothetical protein
MTAELVIAPEAAQDIDEAYGWYEGRRAGLGEEFLRCVVCDPRSDTDSSSFGLRRHYDRVAVPRRARASRDQTVRWTGRTPHKLEH